MVCCPTRQRKEAVEQLIKNSTFGDDLSPSAQTRRNKKIVHIPGGVGHIGTNQPKIPVDGENPLRTRRIKSFLMDSCTVTNARFQEFINETGYITEAERLGDSLVFHLQLAPDFPPTQGIAVAPWWRVVVGANWLQINGPNCLRLKILGSSRACNLILSSLFTLWASCRGSLAPTYPSRTSETQR